jgi:hypothetical protein
VSTQYWFKDEAKEIASKLQGMHGGWSVWSTNPIAQSWIRHSIAYYSTVIDPASWDTSLVFEGQQGELVKMGVPQARSLIRQLVTLLTRQKLAFKALAEATGTDVSNELKLGNALADHIVEKQDLEMKRSNLVEQALIYGMAYLKTVWRTDKGEFYVVDPDDQAVMTNGELEIGNVSVFDVFFDYSVENWDDLDWVEVRTIKNRWTLIAQFPEMEQELRNAPAATTYRSFWTQSFATAIQEDMIHVFEVYHKPTPALPEGRMVVYCGQDVILYDGPNIYGKIPVTCMKPEPIHGLGMGFGYPFFANLLPSQEMLDHSFSAIATNQSAFAVQNVTVPRGADLGVQEIAGMNFISFTPTNASGGGKPEALQLTQSSPETFKFIDILLAHMQQISNVNSALRGEPPPGVTSGAAIATLTTNAIEFINSAAQSASKALQKSVTMGIEVYQKFAKTDRLMSIAGKNGLSRTVEFNSEKIAPITSVRITEVNPVMQTLSGRMDLAEKLLQAGLVTNTREYLSILDGEPVSRMTDVEESENDLIQAENDDLMEGIQVQTLATDDHPTHIREHHAILNDPERRRNSTQVQLVLNHIMEHWDMLRGPNAIDPALLAVIRTGKMPELPPDQPMMGGGGAPMSQPEQEPVQGAAAPAQPAPDVLGREGA